MDRLCHGLYPICQIRSVSATGIVVILTSLVDRTLFFLGQMSLFTFSSLALNTDLGIILKFDFVR